MKAEGFLNQSKSFHGEIRCSLADHGSMSELAISHQLSSSELNSLLGTLKQSRSSMKIPALRVFP